MKSPAQKYGVQNSLPNTLPLELHSCRLSLLEWDLSAVLPDTQLEMFAKYQVLL